MLDLLRSFEQASAQLSPVILVVPGVALVGLGLFVWLGGLGFKRLLLGTVWAVTGGAAVLVLGSRNAPAVLISALATAIAAAAMQRLFTASLLGLLALTVAFLALAGPFLHEQHIPPVAAQGLGTGQSRLTIAQSLSAAHAYGLGMVDSIRGAAGWLAPLHWGIVAAAAVGFLALGLLFRRFGGALAFAMIGTTLIFTGLTALMMFKGSTPLARMSSQPVYYGLVFTGMAAFGTLEQFALCRQAETKGSKPPSGKSRRYERPLKQGWRSR